MARKSWSTGWVVEMDSVSKGEAFIIVRNNSEQAISLPAGTLNITIRPIICLPRILSRADVQKVEAAKSEPEDPAADPNSPKLWPIWISISFQTLKRSRWPRMWKWKQSTTSHTSARQGSCQWCNRLS
jgi:hypothetical protein